MLRASVVLAPRISPQVIMTIILVVLYTIKKYNKYFNSMSALKRIETIKKRNQLLCWYIRRKFNNRTKTLINENIQIKGDKN